MWPSPSPLGLRPLAIALVALTTAAHLCPAEAQQLSFDSVTGTYTVSIVIDGSLVEKTLVPADRVELTVSPALAPAPEGWSYKYIVKETEGSPQNLAEISVPCSVAGGSEMSTSAVPTPDTTGAGPWYSFRSDLGTVDLCSFLGGAVPLGPVDTLTITIVSDLLPAIGAVRAVGAGAGFTTSFSDVGFEGSVEVFNIEARLNGTDGGWKEVTTIVPMRSPTEFHDPQRGLSLITRDVLEACNDLGWINQARACLALEAHLGAASEAIASGDANGARAELLDFLSELTSDSTSVRVEARYLLAFNAQYLVDTLVQG